MFIYITVGGRETKDKSMQTKDKNKWEEVKHDNAITKPKKIDMHEELEDTVTFLEGPRSGHEDHLTRDWGKEGRFVIE